MGVKPWASSLLLRPNKKNNKKHLLGGESNPGQPGDSRLYLTTILPKISHFISLFPFFFSLVPMFFFFHFFRFYLIALQLPHTRKHSSHRLTPLLPKKKVIILTVCCGAVDNYNNNKKRGCHNLCMWGNKQRKRKLYVNKRERERKNLI